MARTLAEFLTKRTFRWLLAIQLVFGILGAVADHVFLPEEITDWVEYYTPEFSWLWLLAVAPLIGTLVSFVGLWLFRNWARRLLLISTLLMIPVEWFIGPYAMIGIGSVLNTLGMYVYGATLVLVYMPPISRFFEEGRAESSQYPKH